VCVPLSSPKNFQRQLRLPPRGA